MPRIRLTENITHRSEHLPAGTVLEEDPVTAGQLVAAGHAVIVPETAAGPDKAKKPLSPTNPQE